MTPAPVVELRDGSNVPVQQAGVLVTVSKGSGPGTVGGTLQATTDAQGRATFTNVTVTGAGTYALSFASAGLTGIGSNSFVVTNPAANALQVVTQPTGGVSGSAVTPAPVVELRDGATSRCSRRASW